MTVAEWFVASLFIGTGPVAFWLIRREWRMPWYTKMTAPGWWVWGEALWEAQLRALPFMTVAGVALGASLPSLEYRARASGWSAVVLGVVAGGVLSTMLFGLLGIVTTALLNWPKFAVPPARRSDCGLLLRSERSIARRAKSIKQ